MSSSGVMEPLVKYQFLCIGILTSTCETRRWTVSEGQFDWGGFLLKSNGGAQRYTQHGQQSCVERIGISVLDCKSHKTSRCESRSK